MAITNPSRELKPSVIADGEQIVAPHYYSGLLFDLIAAFCDEG